VKRDVGVEAVKQVWLVHKSGERRGPYETRKFTAHREVQITTIDGWTALDESLLEALGFRIEEALPEKVTVTREAFMRFMLRPYTGDGGYGAWRALCDEAGK
jgi:hypothetical protein